MKTEALPNHSGPTIQGGALLFLLILAVAFAVTLVFAGPLPAIALSLSPVLVVFLRNPFAALCLLVVLIAVEPLSTLIPSAVYTITALKLVGYLLAAGLAIHLAISRSTIYFDKANVALLVLLVIMPLSCVAAVSLESAFEDYLRYIQLGILFFAVRYLVRDVSRLRTLALLISATLAFSAAVAVFQFVAGNVDRVSGTSHNAALLAVDILTGLGFAFALLLTTRAGGQKLLWLVVLGILCLGLYMSQSRSAFIAVFIAGALAVWAAPAFRKAAITLTVILLAGFIVIGGVQGRFQQAVQLSDTSSKGHLYTFKAGVQMALDHPILGVGLGNYQHYYLDYSHDPRRLDKTAHNTYLAFAAECGFPTMLAFLAFAGACLGTIWCCNRRAPRDLAPWFLAVFVPLFAILVIGLFHTVNFNKYFWILLGLAANWKTIAGNAER